MREEVSQPWPFLPTLASGLGWGVGRAQQLEWDWAAEIFLAAIRQRGCLLGSCGFFWEHPVLVLGPGFREG